MKVRVLIGWMIVAGLLGAGTSSAQPVVSGGIKGGVNLATVSSDDNEETSNRVGGIFGGYVTWPLADMVAFQPEVLYSMKGAKFTEGSDEATAQIDEVEIPLLLRIGRRMAGGYAIIGPNIGVITKAKFKFEGQEEDFKDELKSTDIGLTVGAGWVMNRFLIEARYTAGLSNLNKDDSEKNKSRTFSVLAGVEF